MEIEKAIEGLKPEEFRELLGWLEQKGRATSSSDTPSWPAWPDFAARQRDVFGEGVSLPADYVDKLIRDDRGE